MIERHIKKQVTAQLDDAESVREQVAAEELARMQKAAESDAESKTEAAPAPAAENETRSETVSPEAAAPAPAPEQSDASAEPNKSELQDVPSAPAERPDPTPAAPDHPDLRSRAVGLFSLFSRKKKN